ncbi:MAG: hypothetical protein HY718_12245, partial [Planctomycetes bacterium]|nr:hypothetical protein [Planctomycetota bacterium]
MNRQATAPFGHGTLLTRAVVVPFAGNIDTTEDVLASLRPALRVEMPRSFADKLRRREVPEPILQHLYRNGFSPDYRINAYGADGAPTVHMATLYMAPELASFYRAGQARASAAHPGTIHALTYGSLASSTGPALCLASAPLLRATFSGDDRGDNARSDYLGVLAGPCDGTNPDRHAFRRAVTLATLESLNALALAVYDRRKEGGIEIPGLGRLSQPPYDIVWLSSDRLCGAETVDELAKATHVLALVLADRD